MGDGEPDARSDIYSLGAVAYYLLTGVPPFVSDKPLKVLFAHAHEEVTPPRSCVRTFRPIWIGWCCAAWPRIHATGIRRPVNCPPLWPNAAGRHVDRAQADEWWRINEGSTHAARELQPAVV